MKRWTAGDLVDGEQRFKGIDTVLGFDSTEAYVLPWQPQTPPPVVNGQPSSPAR